MSRDEFSKLTIETLGKRANYQCSRPGCGKQTIGPSAESNTKVAGIGRAAHITAAAPGGPRYDPSMTPEQRSSIDNAIWLCADDAALIDADTTTYTVDLLRDWKVRHEAIVATRIGVPSTHTPIVRDPQLHLRLLEIEDELHIQEDRCRLVQITYVRNLWPGHQGTYNAILQDSSSLTLEVGQTAAVRAETAAVMKADFGDAFEVIDPNLPLAPRKRGTPFPSEEELNALRQERSRLRLVLGLAR